MSAAVAASTALPFAAAAHGTACLWACASDAWTRYLGALLSGGPGGAFEANAQLFTDGLDLYGRAAGLMLRQAGLEAPLLNDA